MNEAETRAVGIAISGKISRFGGAKEESVAKGINIEI